MTRADAIDPPPKIQSVHGQWPGQALSGIRPGLEAGLDHRLSQETGVSGSLATLKSWHNCCAPGARYGEDGQLRRATEPPHCVPILHRAPNPAGFA